MFLTDAQIKTALAAALTTSESNLGAHWTNDIIGQSHTAAYQDIVTRLTARGFTLAQITAWDRGAEVEKHLSVYWCLINGGAAGNFTDLFLKQLDRRPELDKMGSLVIAGVWTKPANTGDGPGLIGTGKFDTSGDQFVPFDPDARTGDFTRW